MDKLFIYYSLTGNGDEVAKIFEKQGYEIRKVIEKKKIDVSNIKFKEKELIYDGSIKTIDIDESTVPDGVMVSVSANAGTNAGTYYASAEVFTLDQNYEVVNVPTDLARHKWVISKGDAKFINISNPSRGCNKEQVAITYTNNVNAEAKIYYKERNASDEEYSLTAPKNAGEYTAKLVIDSDNNYNGCVEYINFQLYKTTIKYPTMIHDSVFVNRGFSYFTGTYQSVVDQLVGFDADIMTFISSSPDVSQKDPGEYIYYLGIKDEEKDNFEFEGNSNQIFWIINNALVYILNHANK